MLSISHWGLFSYAALTQNQDSVFYCHFEDGEWWWAGPYFHL